MGASMNNSQRNESGMNFQQVQAALVAEALKELNTAATQTGEATSELIIQAERQAVRDEGRKSELLDSGALPPTKDETRELQALVTSTVDAFNAITQDSLRAASGFSASVWPAYIQELEVVRAQTEDVRDRMLLLDKVSADDAKGITQLMSEVEETLEMAQSSLKRSEEADDEYYENPLASW